MYHGGHFLTDLAIVSLVTIHVFVGIVASFLHTLHCCPKCFAV